MERREKIKQILKILKKEPRLQKNELVRRIVKEGIMSHQTASNAIDDAVKSQKIIREEAYRGKQKIVWLSVSKDFSKHEKDALQALMGALKEYDSKFAIIQEKFPSLSIDQKVDGVDLLTHFLLEFGAAMRKLSHLFGKTSEWTKFEDEITTREKDMQKKLEPMCSEKEKAQIFLELLAINYLDMNDELGDLNDYLKDIKK